MGIAVLGIDLAKHVFQLHGVDAHGRAVVALANKTARIAWVLLARGETYQAA